MHQDLQAGVEVGLGEVDDSLALLRDRDRGDRRVCVAAFHRLQLVADGCDFDPFGFDLERLREFFPQFDAEAGPFRALLEHKGRNWFNRNTEHLALCRVLGSGDVRTETESRCNKNEADRGNLAPAEVRQLRDRAGL